MIAGEVALTTFGEIRRNDPGETYDISAEVEHAVHVKAGAVVIDVFEEADR